MNISLLQIDITWAQPELNRLHAEKAILSAPKSDVYVLPEMWSTGFVTKPGEYDNQPDSPIEGEDGATLHWMQTMAQRMDAAIAGSVAIKAADGTYRNRFYFVTPQQVTYYDKHHLFTYGGEHLRYTPGNERVIVEWRGVRFLLLVCYDLRFPIWSRNIIDVNIENTTQQEPVTRQTPRAAFDCILYVASWPTPRVEAWRTLLLARAIENQCYVCGVNRVGTDPVCQYSGGTAFVDPYGIRQNEVPMTEEGIISAEIDIPSLEVFRRKFPVLNDRD